MIGDDWGQVKKITVWDYGGQSPFIPLCDVLDLTPIRPQSQSSDQVVDGAADPE